MVETASSRPVTYTDCLVVYRFGAVDCGTLAPLMQTLKPVFVRCYAGRNRYCDWPAIHVRLQGASGADFHRPDQFIPRVRIAAGGADSDLEAWLRRACECADEGLELIAGLAVTLQNLVGARVDDAHSRGVGTGSEIDLMCGYECEAAGRAALEFALVLAYGDQLPTGAPTDEVLRNSFAHFLRVAPQLGLDQTTVALTRAAEARDIPVHRMSDRSCMVRLGQGRLQNA